jgi:hypothetical protein
VHSCEPPHRCPDSAAMTAIAPDSREDRPLWAFHAGGVADGNREIASSRIRRRDLASAAKRALARVAGGRLRVLPVAVRFSDGSTLLAAGAGASAPVVLLNGPQALSYLVHEPSQAGLARAWVTGAVDVEGDLEDVLKSRHRVREISLSTADGIRLAGASLRAGGPTLFRRPPSPGSRQARAEAGTRSPRTGRPCATTTTSATTSTGSSSDPA